MKTLTGLPYWVVVSVRRRKDTDEMGVGVCEGFFVTMVLAAAPAATVWMLLGYPVGFATWCVLIISWTIFGQSTDPETQ